MSHEHKLVRSRAHLSPVDVLAMSNTPTPTEGIFGTALATIEFSYLFILSERPPFPARESTASTYTFGDASLAILLGSLNIGQPYDTVGESAYMENQPPSQESVNKLDKGGRAWHFNQGQR